MIALETKQENLKLEANIVTGKAKQLTGRERYDYWAKQILELKLQIPTQDKSGKTVFPRANKGNVKDGHQLLENENSRYQQES